MYGGTTGPWDGTASVNGVVNLTWPNITIPYTNDFESAVLTTDGWSTQIVVGTMDWEIANFSGSDNYAEMSNYSGGNSASETWLVSPTIDLSGATTPLFSFDNACNYSGDDIAVYVSTDYAGDVTTASWDTLSPVLSAGGFSEVNSGDLDLTAYVGGDLYIAFKYVGTDADGKTWQIDDISIVEAPLFEAPVIENIVATPAYPTSSDAISVTADVTDADGTVSTVTLNWGTVSGTLDNAINMSSSKAAWSTDTQIPAQADGTVIYYNIVAVDSDAQTTTTDEMMISVVDPATATLPYTNTFDTDLGDMYVVDLVGDQGWYQDEYNGSTYAKMSGFSGGAQENVDWLITPAFDFTGLTDIQLQFDEAINYGGTIADEQEIFVSTDYAGVGDPTSATWTELTVTGRALELVGIGLQLTQLAFRLMLEKLLYTLGLSTHQQLVVLQPGKLIA
jgi:hypothetical protein